MPEATFTTFLATAFATLEREVPWAYVGVARGLAPRVVRLDVDGEVVGLRCAPRAVSVERDVEHPTIAVRTGRADILAVIDAEASLLSAVLDDRLHLQGSPDDLLAFHDALMLWVHGAVRAPSFPGLLRSFRGVRGVGAAA